jgi:hypothetical protein
MNSFDIKTKLLANQTEKKHHSKLVDGCTPQSWKVERLAKIVVQTDSLQGAFLRAGCIYETPLSTTYSEPPSQENALGVQG